MLLKSVLKITNKYNYEWTVLGCCCVIRFGWVILTYNRWIDLQNLIMYKSLRANGVLVQALQASIDDGTIETLIDSFCEWVNYNDWFS